MSKFISLRILASLSKTKKTTSLTPRTPAAGAGAGDVTSDPTRDEPTSSSRIRVNRGRVE